MRYIGGKALLTDDIIQVIKDNTTNVKTVCDIFSGSGAVANRFKKEGYKVIANDMLYFSYVLLRGTLALSKEPGFKGLDVDPFEYLNIIKTDIIDADRLFIYNNYSPTETCNRMYFQNENAIRIDLIRSTIEEWYKTNKIDEDEYFYLLAALISAVPYVSNITGVYSAYLKKWDSRTYDRLVLERPKIIQGEKAEVYNRMCNDLLGDIEADVLYADPPYNNRQYLPNYHILETIAKYDYPEIKGITGMREYENQKSDFCIRSKVKQAFIDMIEKANVRYIVISYNTEGLLSKEELEWICKQYAKDGTFKLIEIDYRRYKSKIPNNSDGLCELIYFFEKENIR